MIIKNNSKTVIGVEGNLLMPDQTASVEATDSINALIRSGELLIVEDDSPKGKKASTKTAKPKTTDED